MFRTTVSQIDWSCKIKWEIYNTVLDLSNHREKHAYKHKNIYTERETV